jgi:hypothetical protein
MPSETMFQKFFLEKSPQLRLTLIAAKFSGTFSCSKSHVLNITLHKRALSAKALSRAVARKNGEHD